MAFANTQGGTLLLGIADNGEIISTNDDKNYEEYLANIARNKVIPAIEIGIEKTTVENKTVIAVTIPKGKDKHEEEIIVSSQWWQEIKKRCDEIKNSPEILIDGKSFLSALKKQYL